MIAGCYIRVSTEEQTEYSPDAQLRAIKDYCKKNDMELDTNHIYTDAGISGKKAEKRPAFMSMIANAKRKPKPFDVILVHKFDRFARNREDSVVYKSLLRKDCGVKVISITEHIEDDKSSVILEAMYEAMSEYYSLNLAEEVRKGQHEKILKGEHLTMPSLGYRTENKKYIIIEEEAKIVRLIFEKFAEGMGQTAIAKLLNSMNLKTKKGNKFSSRAIEIILTNPVYIGFVRWTPKYKKKRVYDDPDTITTKSTHESIISMDIWDRVKERIEANKKIFSKYQKNTNKKRHWLSSLIVCSECGNKLLIHDTGVYTNKYLQCSGYLKGLCDKSHSLTIRKIEPIILEQIKKDFTTPIRINFKENEANSEVGILNNELEKLIEKENRIKYAYQNGVDTLEEYKQNKLELALCKKNIIENLQTLKAGDTYNVKKAKSKVKEVYKILIDEDEAQELKYKISHLLIEKIIYNKEEQTFTFFYN